MDHRTQRSSGPVSDRMCSRSGYIRCSLGQVLDVKGPGFTCALQKTGKISAHFLGVSTVKQKTAFWVCRLSLVDFFGDWKALYGSSDSCTHAKSGVLRDLVLMHSMSGRARQRPLRGLRLLVEALLDRSPLPY